MSLAARFLRRAPARAAPLSVVSNRSDPAPDQKQREQDPEEKHDDDKKAESEASEQGGRPKGVQETNGYVLSELLNRLRSCLQTYTFRPRGKEPTRYGDWERNGRCIDF